MKNFIGILICTVLLALLGGLSAGFAITQHDTFVTVSAVIGILGSFLGIFGAIKSAKAIAFEWEDDAWEDDGEEEESALSDQAK